MLKRSPRSRATLIIITILSTIGIAVAVNAFSTLHSMTSRYGGRTIYFQATRSLSSGERVSASDFSKHELFSGDAPKNAVTSSPENLFVTTGIAEGAIVTSAMVSKNLLSESEDERVIFVPTDDELEESISNTADLLAVSSDGFETRNIATSAEILFDLSHSDDDSHKGYFVKVTDEEAENIVLALSQGDVHFALVAADH